MSKVMDAGAGHPLPALGRVDSAQGCNFSNKAGSMKTEAKRDYARRYRAGEITPVRCCGRSIAQMRDAHILDTVEIRAYRREAIDGMREEYSLPTPRPVKVVTAIGYTGTLHPGGI